MKIRHPGSHPRSSGQPGTKNIPQPGNDDCEACGGNGYMPIYEDGRAVGKEPCPWCSGAFDLETTNEPLTDDAQRDALLAQVEESYTR